MIGSLKSNFLPKDYETKAINSIGKQNENVNDASIFGIKNNEDSLMQISDDLFQIDENSQEYKTDTQQLNEDAVWLAELYQGVQDGEEWAMEEAKNLQIAAAPEANDNSSNAQLLKSNNELAAAIKAMVANE